MKRQNRTMRRVRAKRAAGAEARYWVMRREIAEAEHEAMRREIEEAEMMRLEESHRVRHACFYDEGYFSCSGCTACSSGIGGADYD